jgi:hypothetical protein
MLQTIRWFCRFRYLMRKTYFPLRTMDFDYSAVLRQYITTFKAFSICKQFYRTADMVAKPLGVLSHQNSKQLNMRINSSLALLFT